MRVLCLHSRYLQRGGEDVSFDVECGLLQAAGHEVLRMAPSAAELATLPAHRQAVLALQNPEAAQRVRDLVDLHSPDVAYCNNLFPMLGPTVTALLERLGLPQVHAVRNYRFACLNGLLWRDGHPCTQCLTVHSAGPGIVHGCYRGSVAGSAVAAMARARTRRHLRGERAPVRYAALSRHVAGRLTASGVPAELVDIKPNTVRAEPCWDLPEPMVALVGRLEPEKGIGQALAAASHLPSGWSLAVAGDGSMRSQVEATARREPRVRYLGQLPGAAVLRLMARCTATLVPSLWEEPFGRVAVESLAVGTPVVVSARGGLPEIVAGSPCGMVVDPADSAGLGRALASVAADPAWRVGGRRLARDRFEAAYSPAAVTRALEASLIRAASR